MATQLKTPTDVRAQVSAEEWERRVDLACAYRLVAHYGWDDLIFTHLSVRVPGPEHHFLINPYNLMFDEITASSLVKIDVQGNPVMETPYLTNPAGFTIHSAIYRARPDAAAAMHTHTIAGMAVSALKCGLLPLTQTATRFYGRIAYHDFRGPERDPSERDALAKSIGPLNYCILRNHGLLTLGASMPEAFIAMWGLERSCQAQLAAMACNTELEMPSPEVVQASCAMYGPGSSRKYGLLEWPGLLRQLDRTEPDFRD